MLIRLRQRFDVQSLDQIGVREARILKISQSKKDRAAFQLHLKKILEDPAFKGSHRSTQFLIHIIELSLAGKFDSLKERLIGVDLFGRDPSYDTGEDAIVRGTASDVRKRLLQFYGRNGTSYEFRISLPLGSYIPEIIRRSKGEVLPDVDHADAQSASMSTEAFASEEDRSLADHAAIVDSPGLSLPRKKSLAAQNWIRWTTLCALLLALNLGLWGIFRGRATTKKDPSSPPVLPWSAIFGAPRSTVLITSDPNIAEIESFTGRTISISDYANHRYVPNTLALSPQIAKICQVILIGNRAADVDVPIAAHIAQIAQTNSRVMDIRPARHVQLAELYADNNFILLGSPRSDPWADLFHDQLDFRFYTPKGKVNNQIIVNAHPHQHEQSAYIPNAMHGITGQTYAIVAFVSSLNRAGHVLIIAGADEEGTEAAGKFIVDLPRLSATLQNCGISPSGPVRHFELLMALNTIAGSPTNIDIVACHILP